MSVWVVCPSKRPADQVNTWAQAWRERGYNVAVWRDGAAEFTEWKEQGVDLYCSRAHYPGYAQSVNWLIAYVMQERSSAEWFIAAGDDVYPDPNHTAEEIALECEQHFAYQAYRKNPNTSVDQAFTEMDRGALFGVMQPTGDRDFGDAQGPYIDRVAGSAWIGRSFAERMYGGKGPLWPEYFHMGVDEELQAVAIMYGVFWQRPDLTQYHQHWGRPKPGEKMGHAHNRPAFLDKANSQKEWDRYKDEIFGPRKAAGFPGSEPL